jgi:hypothetical protein
MNTSLSKFASVIKLFLLYIGFYIVGLSLAYWYGMGWFILFHTLRGLFNSIPRINVPILRFLIDPGYLINIEDQWLNKKSPWFKSITSLVVNIFNVLLTIFGFWKINIPLRVIVDMLVR